MIPLMRFEEVRDAPKPAWLKIRPPYGDRFADVKATIHEAGLHTVCESAHCPNLSECWSGGTATFMVLGNTCTRGCRFCSVPKSVKGDVLDADEPAKLAQAVKRWGLSYAVITSVDRDDLPDQGAGHFANVIRELHRQAPDVLVEVLTPDFRGSRECVQQIVDAKPTVFAHNVETTRDLQKMVRDPRAGFEQSLTVLKMVKEMDSGIYTKSSIMLGLGETEEGVLAAFDDLRQVGCDLLTLGQYLRPSPKHVPITEYVTSQKFNHYRDQALARGFKYVAAGPLVRSSYKAGELYGESIVKGHSRVCA